MKIRFFNKIIQFVYFFWWFGIFLCTFDVMIKKIDYSDIEVEIKHSLYKNIKNKD